METTAVLKVTMTYENATSRSYTVPFAEGITPNIETIKNRIKSVNAAIATGADNPTTAAEHAAHGIKETFVSSVNYNIDTPSKVATISEATVIITETSDVYTYS